MKGTLTWIMCMAISMNIGHKRLLEHHKKYSGQPKVGHAGGYEGIVRCER